MKTETILYAAGGIALAAVALAYARRTPAGAMSGDSERVSGVAALYGTNVAQQQMTDAAIKANWDDISKATASQPDWWI